jgi:3-oxoacyl-[acyl-carrier-protein] synthase-3
VPVHGSRRCETGFEVSTGYYTMQGTEIVQAGWTTDDLDLVIAHHPNTRTLQIAMKACGISMDIVPNPCAGTGNLGPANALTTLAIAREQNTLPPNTPARLVSYGIGLSCGAMAVTL